MEENKAPTRTVRKRKQQQHWTMPIGAGMAIGAGCGAALGSVIENIGIGVALGVAVGLVVGSMLAAQRFKKK